MYNCFGILFRSDIDHFNSATPELTVLLMEEPRTQRMRPICSSQLAAITPKYRIYWACAEPLVPLHILAPCYTQRWKKYSDAVEKYFVKVEVPQCWGILLHVKVQRSIRYASKSTKVVMQIGPFQNIIGLCIIYSY